MKKKAISTRCMDEKGIEKILADSARRDASAGLRWKTLKDFQKEEMPTGPMKVKAERKTPPLFYTEFQGKKTGRIRIYHFAHEKMPEVFAADEQLTRVSGPHRSKSKGPQYPTFPNLEIEVSRLWTMEGKVIAYLMQKLGVKEISIEKKFQKLPKELMISKFDEEERIVELSIR